MLNLKHSVSIGNRPIVCFSLSIDIYSGYYTITHKCGGGVKDPKKYRMIKNCSGGNFVGLTSGFRLVRTDK